jgi:hypothetical protein
MADFHWRQDATNPLAFSNGEKAAWKLVADQLEPKSLSHPWLCGLWWLWKFINGAWEFNMKSIK